MKKNVVYLFGLLVMSVFLFSACSSSGSSPGEAAKKYMNHFKTGDYEKFVDGMAVGEDSSEEEIKAGKAMMLAMMDKAKKQIDAKGGIKDIEVVSETISDDGKTAKVVLKTTYGDGSTEEKSNNMILEKGDWKMDVKM